VLSGGRGALRFARRLEGMHRYNSAYHEQESMICAWVAHIGCCDRPWRRPSSRDRRSVSLRLSRYSMQARFCRYTPVG
jgi:hypothetical protein